MLHEVTSDDLTLGQAAELLGVTAQTVRRYVKQGKLPKRYIQTVHGAQIVVSQADVEQLKTDQRAVITPITTPTTHHTIDHESVMTTLATYQQGHQTLVQGYQQALQWATDAQTTLAGEVRELRAEVERLRARLETPRAPWWRFWRRA